MRDRRIIAPCAHKVKREGREAMEVKEVTEFTEFTEKGRPGLGFVPGASALGARWCGVEGDQVTTEGAEESGNDRRHRKARADGCTIDTED